MTLVGPPSISFNPAGRLTGDLVAERRVEVPFPPGETLFSVRRTRAFARDPLTLLLDGYDRFGPVFTMRIFHGNSRRSPPRRHPPTVKDSFRSAVELSPA